MTDRERALGLELEVVRREALALLAEVRRLREERVKAVTLAQLVRQVWRQDPEACMKLFGNNATAMLAREVEYER